MSVHHSVQQHNLKYVPSPLYDFISKMGGICNPTSMYIVCTWPTFETVQGTPHYPNTAIADISSLRFRYPKIK